jgi:lysozyme family protein
VNAFKHLRYLPGVDVLALRRDAYMANPILTGALKKEYTDCFAACAVGAAYRASAETTARTIGANQSRYGAVVSKLSVPWYVVAVIHAMESSLNFNLHLHNGDPLTGRTTHTPAGRPLDGDPPFTWEESALDAILYRHLDEVDDWSIGGALYQLEAYNGFGYRRLDPPISSPYLWSFSQFYTRGKFVADGVFNPDVVSKQCGGAVLLKVMENMGLIRLARDSGPGALAA